MSKLLSRNKILKQQQKVNKCKLFTRNEIEIYNQQSIDIGQPNCDKIKRNKKKFYFINKKCNKL